MSYLVSAFIVANENCEKMCRLFKEKWADLILWARPCLAIQKRTSLVASFQLKSPVNRMTACLFVSVLGFTKQWPAIIKSLYFVLRIKKEKQINSRSHLDRNFFFFLNTLPRNIINCSQWKGDLSWAPSNGNQMFFIFFRLHVLKSTIAIIDISSLRHSILIRKKKVCWFIK